MSLNRKSFWITTLILLLGLSLIACGTRRAELDKPRGVELDEREVLTWSAVENAVRYEVDVNGVSYWTEEESLDLFERIVQPGEYRIRVCAYGGKGELPSDWSEAVSYTLDSPQGLIGFAEVEGGLTVSAVNPSAIKGKLVIPEAVGGVPVVRIYGEGFSGCTNMTGLILPNTVSRIGAKAFFGCTSLKRVKLSEALESLVNTEFSECSALTQVELPEGITALGNTFTGCTLLRTVSFPSTLVSIWNTSFLRCQNLTELTVAEGNPEFYSEKNCVIRKADQTLVLGGNGSVIPNDVKAIGEMAFSDRTGLERLEIPSNVTRIEGSAFFRSGLTELELPESVTEIGNFAFSQTALDRVALSRVTEIGAGAFAGCDRLAELSVAEGNPVYRSAGNCILLRADNELVAACPASVIPEEITAVGQYAFGYLKTIRELALPAGVKTIEDNAFYACTGLETVYLPNGLLSIGNGAFGGCPLLSSIVLPDSVTTIGKSAFEICTIYTSCGMYSMPEGWYRPGYISLDSWMGSGIALSGCNISSDGVYPYVSACGGERNSDFAFWGMVSQRELFDNPRIPKRVGYTFAGWATEEGSTEVVYGVPIVSSEITGYPCDAAVSLRLKERKEIPYGTVLYAVWVPQS